MAHLHNLEPILVNELPYQLDALGVGSHLMHKSDKCDEWLSPDARV